MSKIDRPSNTPSRAKGATLAQAQKLADQTVADESEDNQWGQVLADKLEEKISVKDIKQLIDLASAVNVPVLIQAFVDLASRFEQQYQFQHAITTLSVQTDALKDAVIALTAKLDAENVTNLDTDYEDTVRAVLL